MKKLSAVLAAVIVALSLAGCNGSNESTPIGSNASSASNESSTSSIEESKPEQSTTGSKPEQSTLESKPEQSAPESKPEQSTPESKPEQSTTGSKPEQSAPESKPEQSTPESKPEEKPSVSIADAAALLNASYDKFEEDVKFPAMGGDYNHTVDGKAGAFDISDAASFANMSVFPQAEIGKIDSAATIVHMMNANTFTGTAVHVKAGTDMTALTKEIEKNVLNNHWMCGFPEKLVIVTVEDYIAYAFGYGDAISAFSKHLKESYSSATVVCDVPIE